MLRERTTAYLRHLHLVVHSQRRRLRFPIYVIQSEATPSVPPSPRPLLRPLYETKEDAFRICRRKKYSYGYCFPLLVFLICCLIAAIALLSSLFFDHPKRVKCEIYDCSWQNSSIFSTVGSPLTTTHSFDDIDGESDTTYSLTINSVSTSAPTSNKNRLYGESCTEHDQCALSKYLFCEYEFDLNEKRCFCETTFFWNAKIQQCEHKKAENEICEYDIECRLDLGFACDLKIGTSRRRCRCLGQHHWSKLSNCGNLKIRDFVHCTDEFYISSCLIKEIETGTYHNVNIRQIKDGIIEFDYFLLDSPDIQEIERIECTWSMNKRYCFGIDNEANRLLIVILGINGIESYGRINQSVIGLPNVLTEANHNIVCYVESNNSSLLSITLNPTENNFLSVQQRGGKTYGERSCFIALNYTSYCFYRDIEHRLTAVAMHGTHTEQDVHMDINPDTNLKTGPSCGWVGADTLWKLYCFAVFYDEQIHRIEQKDNVWNDWVTMSSEKIFIQRPLFVTSKPPDDVSTAQSCHVLAIDTSNEVYVSSNLNCAHEESFSQWSLLQTDVGLLSFNGSFRLRDGRVGVFGIGIDDLPYYTTMNPVTHNFAPIRLAVSYDWDHLSTEE